MRDKVDILMVVVLLGALAGYAMGAGDDSALSKEYRIKAAFIYNFIKFVDWPQPAPAESDKKADDTAKPITIGIIGKDLFGDAFEPVKGKPVRGRKIVVKQFGEFRRLVNDKSNDKAKSEANIEALRQCQLLFTCSSEKKDTDRIIEIVRGHKVQTIGETDGFVEAGGIVNFILEEKKLIFEVNLVASKRANLEISSKLLRVAKRVITEKTSEKAKD